MSPAFYAGLLLGLGLAAALWWVWGAISDGLHAYRGITGKWVKP